MAVEAIVAYVKVDGYGFELGVGEYVFIRWRYALMIILCEVKHLLLPCEILRCRSK